MPHSICKPWVLFSQKAKLAYHHKTEGFGKLLKYSVPLSLAAEKYSYKYPLMTCYEEIQSTEGFAINSKWCAL